MNTKILIVEDQFIEANNLRNILKTTGYSVCPIASSVPEALEIIGRERPDMVLLDIYLQGPLTGIDLGAILMEQNIAFVYLSANSERDILNQAKVTRPYGFLVKPFRKKDVLVTLDVAWYLHQQKMQPAATDAPDYRKKGPLNPAAGKQIIGKSPAIKNLLEKVSVVGQSDISVLILGENGTGKELIARYIHQLSARSEKPMITVNCAALPANLIESELFGHEKGAFTGATEKRMGKFEQANEGTIFLDEIGELLPNLQAKLLRTLQEQEIEPIGGRKRTIDVRVIAATNRNMEEEIASGNFRMDLYYRLNVFPLTLPTLRDRKEDIPLLADHFLHLYAQKEKKTITGFAEHVIRCMIGYDWPGNVRELANFVARSVIMTRGQIIDFVDLPWSQNKTLPIASPEDSFEAAAPKEKIKSMSEHEKEYILSALVRCNWKLYGQDGAAKLLQMHPSTLNSRMKKLGIHKKSMSKLYREEE